MNKQSRITMKIDLKEGIMLDLTVFSGWETFIYSYFSYYQVIVFIKIYFCQFLLK